MKKTETRPEKKQAIAAQNGNASSNGFYTGADAQVDVHGAPRTAFPTDGAMRHNSHGIPDFRLEVLDFTAREVVEDGEFKYVVEGDLDAPAPPLRDSKYLKPEQSIEIYRWMLLNRKMEETLEKLYKQSKVIGGVYFGLGQEACSCASAYALGKDDWLGPMIRNQGSMLVKGFKPRDTFMQYMAKAGSPSGGRESGSHYGDPKELNVVAPVSHLGDSVSIMTGIALGARIQGKNIACLTYIGDGGQSTGPTYEGFNFAAVQKLGVILMVEHNLWAYSTPVNLQFACQDLADRSIGYGVPGVIIDGTDAHQVYDVTYEAVQRAYRGEGATLIEAKMMRMKGHAIHDAATYVPKPMYEYWRRRDCILRMEKYLLDKGWLTQEQNQQLIAQVDKQLDDDRAIAEASPFPDPAGVREGVYLDNSVEIPLKYGQPKVREINRAAIDRESEANTHYK
ncbi:MAG: thiamine pyrophosphate-dependent dehydrogenase E1 component subunit alpha [Acidobacteriaceae bacterium]